MKNIFKNSLVLVALLTTLLSNANSPLKVSNSELKTTLTLNNVKKGNELFVKDKSGSILYQETIKNAGDYTKNFDLTKLPNGEYYFEVNKSFEINTIPFSVKNSEVTLDKAEETIAFRPFVTSNKNIVKVSNLSLKKKPLEVNIYFDSNESELIYEETIEGTQNISRTFSLNKAKKGKYRIVTKTEGRTFVDYVEL